jgi:uncharacterized protein (DUF983 family)
MNNSVDEEKNESETTVWDIIQSGSIECGNCEVYRTVDGSGEVKKCLNCGDDEYNLCDYADGPAREAESVQD